MSSIIEEYNYDIFISYRQKDNKYDMFINCSHKIMNRVSWNWETWS
jgi:hypothetical protein